jgi:signal transduction histidine kinase
LSDQLLTLSRETAGVAPQACGPVDLSTLVAEEAETMRPLAEARWLVLRAETAAGVHVNGDGSRLRHVFFNLLVNVIKYTPEGGRVEARVEERGRDAASPCATRGSASRRNICCASLTASTGWTGPAAASRAAPGWG